MRQALDIELNLLDGFGRGEFVDCADRQDRLALIDGIVGEAAFAQRVGGDPLAEVGHGVGGLRHIVHREDGLYARHGERGAHVDAAYVPVRHRAEQQLGEQHAVGAIILGVFRAAGHLRDQIGRGVILADQFPRRMGCGRSIGI